LRAFETSAHPYKANVVKYPLQGVRNLIVEEAMTKMAAERAKRDAQWVAEVKI